MNKDRKPNIWVRRMIRVVDIVDKEWQWVGHVFECIDERSARMAFEEI